MDNSYKGYPCVDRIYKGNRPATPGAVDKVYGRIQSVDKINGQIGAPDGLTILRVKQTETTITLFLSDGSKIDINKTPEGLGTAALKNVFEGVITDEVVSEDLFTVKQLLEYIAAKDFDTGEWGDLG